jgi:hypothetical protein
VPPETFALLGDLMFPPSDAPDADAAPPPAASSHETRAPPSPSASPSLPALDAGGGTPFASATSLGLDADTLGFLQTLQR